MFCNYCLQCYHRGLFSLTKKYDNGFVLDGFQNWKKGHEQLERHQKSECHREAVLKLQSMQGPSVITQLDSATKRIQATRRSMLLKQLSSLQFLLRQGQSIRGHTEVEGNLIQLLKLQSDDCPKLRKWLHSNNYLSHQIVNELIKLMGNTLLRQLLTNIRAVRWFLIMANETRDISNNEQLVIVIRWVDLNYDIHEDLIGMDHVPETTSNMLTTVIKDVLRMY